MSTKGKEERKEEKGYKTRKKKKKKGEREKEEYPTQTKITFVLCKLVDCN